MFATRATRNLIILRPRLAYRHGSGGNDNVHGHHHEIKEVHPNSAEYYEKYYGHLASKDPKHSYFFEAITSPAFLQCVAELNASEFKVKPLDAKEIRNKYKEQLKTFESVGVNELEKSGVSKRIIDVLHKVYQMRAKVPQFEIEDGVKSLGFLGNRTNMRATYSDYPDYPLFKLLNPFVWYQWKEIARTNPSKGFTNASRCEHNVRRLKGFIGFARAVQRGLKEEERKLVEKILGPPSEEEKKQISEGIKQIIEASKVSKKKGIAAFKEVYANVPNTPAHKDFFLNEVKALQKRSKALVKADNVEFETTKSLIAPEKQIDNFSYEQLGVSHPYSATVADLDKLFEKCGKPEFFKSFYENVRAFLQKPNVRKDFELLELIGKTEFSADQLLEFSDAFADHTFSDELLNDVANPHPLSAKILGERVSYLATDKVNYTKRFDEGDWTDYNQVDELSPKDKAKFDKIWNSDLLESPTPMHPPFNTALEEIIHYKLIRLAEEIYEIDLSTDLGMATFDRFLHEYDISPGEDTLDRCHAHPPNFHTYDELPILKFDGYSEDFSTFQLEHEKKRNVEH